MPNDSIANRTFREIFQEQGQYVIPFFQRGYAWQRRQWDDLFSDLSEQVLSELEEGTPKEQVRHFFGPMVVRPRAALGGMPQIDVIDGQQRLTTVYLLLALIADQLAQRRHLAPHAGDAAGLLRELLLNDAEGDDDYARLKILSTKGDRLPTYRAVFGAERKPCSPHYEADIAVYRPGKNHVDEFVKFAVRRLRLDFIDIPSLCRLADALLDCLTVVWIPLDEERDDPQAVFESLNDRGMSLTASELLCSYLFRPLGHCEDFEELHNRKWLDAVRALDYGEPFEEYLRCLLSIGERRMLGRGRKVYVHFKMKHRDLDETAAREHLDLIYRSTASYLHVVAPFKSPHPDPEIARRLQTIAQTGIEAANPFLLAVLLALDSGKLQAGRARAMLQEVVVLLVRRKLTEQSTSAYEQLFPNLLARIAKEADAVSAMHDQFRKHHVWVSNLDLEEAMLKRPVYRPRDLDFTRMVLIELDKKLQSKNGGADYSVLQTVEQVIPATLDPYWRDYLGKDARNEQLPTIVNTVGNLCLLASPPSGPAGKDAFESKRGSYDAVSALAQQVKRHKTAWNIEAVQSRSRKLAQVATQVWRWAESESA